MIRQVKRLSLALALILTVLGAPALAGDLGAALKYVPADATTVVAIDLDSMRGSPLFKMALANMGADELRMLQSEVGVDVAKDVKSFIFAGPDELMRRPERFVVIAEVPYDAARISTFIKSQGENIVESKVHGVTTLTVDKEVAFSLDAGFFVFGAPDLVEKALAAKKGKNVSSGALGGLIKQFRGSKTGFAVLGASPRVKKFLSEGVAEFGELQRAGVGLDLSAGLNVSVAGTFANAAAATAVAEALTQGLTEMAEDPEMREAGFAAFLAKATATASDKGVSVGISLNADEVRRLAAALEQMR